ncbi:hypothetical protein EX30DRAFT_207134 [Ascodesmis nigricans]|uniref:DUF7082 domain-containing protein n=1 Tax=Ascodesmis nigricans TaxID=341454 RepID=A0A4S2MKA4_9PEZI|nr:hypothetical protein EX30DRAFT_207134 [Ascodesmis nigricans]
MSGYNKLTQQPDFGTRLPQTQQFSVPHHQSSFNSFTSQPQYAPAPTTTAHPSGYSRAEGGESLIASALPEQTIYPSEPYRPTVEVTNMMPMSGRAGENIVATINTSMDLTNRRGCFILFGTSRTKATVTKLDDQSYRVIGTIPELVGINPARVLLDVEDTETYELGSFTYAETNEVHRLYSPPVRKRKASVDEEQLSASKRIARPPIRPKSVDYGSYGYQTGSYTDSHVAATYQTTPETPRHYTLYPGYDHSSEAMPPPAYPHSSPAQYSYASYSASPESSIPATSSHTWSQPHSTGAPTTLSPSGPSSSGYDLGIATSRSDELVPTLVRTSTLPQMAQGSPNGNGFNPYARGGLNKAQLNMDGDLLDMAKNWTPEEWNVRRRLVRFYRYQKRGTIHARFEPASPNEKHPDSIIVSCIWWAEKNACYVTSVDCISLLESLIAVRFTVEEKNRIRRNLEGFRPLTVSKAKPESENFFKLIMGFPPPKPRNIEKDVKVFPWSILPMALKKIIGKYSASYATTASFIPATPGTTRRPFPDHDPSPSRLPMHPGPAHMLPDPITTSAALPTSDAMAHHSTAGTLSHLHPPHTGSIRTARTEPGLPLPLLPTTGAQLWESHLPAIGHALPPPQRPGQWDVSSFVDAPQTNPQMAPSTGYYHPPAPLSADDRDSLSTGSQAPHPHLSQLQ